MPDNSKVRLIPAAQGHITAVFLLLQNMGDLARAFRTCMSIGPEMLRKILVASLLCSVFSSAALAEEQPRKQFVIVSFDGAGDNTLWDRSRATSAETGAKFTYFLSCTLIMDYKTGKATYQGPGKKLGRSNVGFGQTVQEVETRLNNIWQAHQEGHEIASHGCGHFDGKDWTAADWEAEFETFSKTLENAWEMIGKKDAEPQGWREFAKTDIKGFRAPYLSQSDGLTAAEKKHGFIYDASLVTKGPQYPVTAKDGMTRFGLPLIPEGPNSRPIIAMDYNLFVRHSVGVETPSKAAEFEERAYKAFRAAFDKQYNGERIPLQMGFHFVKMNGGAYWNAYERVLREVCKMQDVSCVNYASYMETLKAEKAEQKPLAGSSF